MRRLTDWDLWLRLIRHVPFVVLDRVVTEVFESNPGSIGRTVPWDLTLFRFLHDIPRGQRLTPSRWRSYPVDTLRPAGVEVRGDLRRRLYEEHVAPHLLRVRHIFPEVEGFCATLPPRRRTILYTKNSYDVSNDVTLNHYDPVASRRGTFKASFQPLDQVEPGWPRDADALLLVRTVEARGGELAAEGLKAGTPVGYYLDDDLLTFHEFGPEFGYLAPGTPYHESLKEQIGLADVVWVTNDFIGESVRPLNPRVVRHGNAVPAHWLPARVTRRDPRTPLRVGYVGSGYRIEEFRQIWPALQAFSEEQRERARFEFWGLDISSLPPLASPVEHKPFTFSYFEYLRRLREAEFDLLLVPLLDRPRPRLGKSLIKYYEAAVAGALGIFSEVPQYAALPVGTTCLKAANTVDGWLEALRQAAAMPSDERDRLRHLAIEHVREEYTETAQIHRHEAALRATEFHARTRRARHRDGRPRVLYLLHSANFGGGEIQLLRRLRRARSCGIEPVVAVPAVLEQSDEVARLATQLEDDDIGLEFAEYTCFDEPRSPGQFRSALEHESLSALLRRLRPALVHSVTFIATAGQVCRDMGVPHVASLYAIGDEFEWPRGGPGFLHAQVVQSDSLRYARRWGGLLATESMCAREVAPDAVFELGRRRRREGEEASRPESGAPRVVVTGTLQPRKGQLEAIAAVGRLRRSGHDCELALYGYRHFFPEYVERCRQQIRKDDLEGRVHLPGFDDDVVGILSSADIVLSCSTFESFPSAIKEAMAGGVLVVATPAGGIPELIVDGVSGILCDGHSARALADGLKRALEMPADRRARIVEQARRVARSEFHPDRATSDMLGLYSRALEIAEQGVPAAHGAAPEEPPPAPAPESPAPGSVDGPSRPPQGPVLLGHRLRYRLSPRRPGWCGLDVLVGTHGRAASGRLRLIVSSRGGTRLRETSADLAAARDNDWLSLRFSPLHNSRGEAFDVRLERSGAEHGTRVSIYESSPLESPLRRLLRRLGLLETGRQLCCRLWHA